MFPCASINYRVGTARIITHHTTNHSPVGSRSFGTKEQAVWFQEHIQFVTYHAGLYTHPMFFLIQFENLGKMFGNINNNPIAHHLTSQRSTGSAGNDRRFIINSKLYQGKDVLLGFGDGNGKRHLPIRRRIGGI